MLCPMKSATTKEYKCKVGGAFKCPDCAKAARKAAREAALAKRAAEDRVAAKKVTK